LRSPEGAVEVFKAIRTDALFGCGVH
jgi:hypothetical protein